MNKTITTLAAALAMAAPVAASAGDQEVRQLKSKDTLDTASGKAYFFYDTVFGKFDVFFLRSLTTQELESYEAKRSEELAEARAKLRDKRDGAPGVSDEELLPDAAFSYVDPDIRNLVRLDSGRVYEKDGKTRTYVVEVPPGEYTIFAAGLDGFMGGTCMCMGTVSFDADAGSVVDLGTLLIAGEDGKSDLAEFAPYEAPEYIRRKALPFKMGIRLPDAGDPAPALFADTPTVVADYRAAGPVPNFMGMLVNRMVPIKGVLSYDEDRILGAERAAAPTPSEKGLSASE